MKSGPRGPKGPKGGNGDDDGSYDPTDPNDVWLTPIQRMSRDLRAASATLGDNEARHLVDSYYIMQEDRKRAAGQIRALSENDEPHSIITWLHDQSETLERQIKSALDVYTSKHAMGDWMRQVYGIGPVISAGLLAHIYMGYWCEVCHGRSKEDCAARQRDRKRKLPRHKYVPIESCPTVGHIWSFAGWIGDKQRPWEKGKLRPYNAKFRTLLWKTGQSFMKFSNVEECYYGRHYREQKDRYIINNDDGGFIIKANERADTVNKDTDAWPWYNGCYPEGASSLYDRTGAGLKTKEKQEAKIEYLKTVRQDPGTGLFMLPPGHIDAMARRWAVKLFLAHLQGEWYKRKFNKPPPLPYPIAHMGHTHFIPSPI